MQSPAILSLESNLVVGNKSAHFPPISLLIFHQGERSCPTIFFRHTRRAPFLLLLRLEAQPGYFRPQRPIPRRSAPSTSLLRRRRSTICAGASTRRIGLNERPSQMRRKEYSSRRFRASRTIGVRSTTGAKSRRN